MRRLLLLVCAAARAAAQGPTPAAGGDPCGGRGHGGAAPGEGPLRFAWDLDVLPASREYARNLHQLGAAVCRALLGIALVPDPAADLWVQVVPAGRDIYLTDGLCFQAAGGSSAVPGRARART